MSIKSIISGSLILFSCGAGAYGMHIYSLTKFLEPVPEAEVARYVQARDAHIGSDGSHRFITWAYQVPAVLPTNHDLMEVFGRKTVIKQASYVAADGAKKVGSMFAEQQGNSALGAVFALQALEKSSPLKQLRSVALFRDNLQVSRQWHYLLHNRKAALAEARNVIASADDVSKAETAAQMYGDTVAELTMEKHVKVNANLRMAMMQGECGTAVVMALEPTKRVQPAAREALLCVVCSTPIPADIEEGSYSYRARKVYSGWYTRWLAANAARSLSLL